MSLSSRSLALCGLILSCAGAHAAEQCNYREVAQLPLAYHGTSMQVSAEGQVNDTPAMLLIDTGAQVTSLTRLGSDKRRLVLQPTGRTVAGVGGDTRAYATPIRSLALGPVQVAGRGAIRVIDEMGTRPEVDGIVGSDFLMQVDVELSLAEKRIRFFSPQGCDKAFLGYWDANAMVVPLDRDRRGIRPMVTVELNGVKLNALIDSGAGYSVVHPEAASKAGAQEDSVALLETTYASGIGQNMVKMRTARFKTFALGDERVDNPVLRIMPLNSEDRIDLILGADFLRAHRILLANSQKRMYFSYVSGKPFDEGKTGDRGWIDQEAQAGNRSAQYLVGQGKLKSADAEVQREGRALITSAADAGYLPAMHFLAHQHYRAARYADSVALYSKIETLDPSDLAAKLNLFNARVKAQGVDEAKARLTAEMDSLRWPVWPAPITEYYLGKLTLEQLLRKAASDDDLAKRRRCEVFTRAAALQDALGDVAQKDAMLANLNSECRKKS
ncbi:MAG: aspartyl protease family protein [Gammaproteobacteria bacterium]